jgi:hypothetical protein
MSLGQEDDSEPSNGHIELPDEFAAHLAAAEGLDQPPETMSEWLELAERRSELPDDPMTAADMYADGETPHEVHLNDVRYSPCVIDALIAARLEPTTPVTVRSMDPVSGEPVTFEVGDDWTATPASVIVSYGTTADMPDPSETDNVWVDVDEEDFGETGVYVCPFINAFESEDHYEQWVGETNVMTMPLTASQAKWMTRKITDSPLFD